MSYINQDISAWMGLVFIFFSIIFLVLSLGYLSKFIHALEQSDKKRFRGILIFSNRRIPSEMNLDPFRFISIFFKSKNKLLLGDKITFISFLFLAVLFFALSFFYF